MDINKVKIGMRVRFVGNSIIGPCSGKVEEIYFPSPDDEPESNYPGSVLMRPDNLPADWPYNSPFFAPWISKIEKEIPEVCERCGEKLDPVKVVWLELDQDTGLYTDGDLPEGHTSQGGFAFGRSCAKAVLANGGGNVRIKKALR